MATAIKILGFTLLVIGIILGLFGVSQLVAPAYYKATTRIEISSSPSPSESNQQPPGYGGYFIQTEFSKIQSEIVLGNAITNLHLGEIWEKKYNTSRRLDVQETIQLLKQRMEFKSERNTSIIDLSVYDPDPKEAADIANAIASAYQNYRVAQWQTNTAIGIKALEDAYNQDEHVITTTLDNLDHLRKQLQIPTPEPTDEILKSNYPDYLQARRDAQNRIDLHKLLQSKITNEKVSVQLSTNPTSGVVVVDMARPPKHPAKPNRFLGILLLGIGLVLSGIGFRLRKSAR